MKHVTGTLVDCDAYEAVCRKTMRLPVRGTHVGGPRHVDIPKSPPGPGWTTAWDEPRPHPVTKDLYAVAVCAAVKDATTELTLAEKLAAAVKEAAATELDETWEPKEEEPVKPTEEPKPIIR